MPLSLSVTTAGGPEVVTSHNEAAESLAPLASALRLARVLFQKGVCSQTGFGSLLPGRRLVPFTAGIAGKFPACLSNINERKAQIYLQKIYE